VSDRPLHPARRRHLEAITGPLGIWQHARAAVPDESFGYCTDDVARALEVDLLQRSSVGWAVVSPTAHQSMQFLDAAFNQDRGGFRNMRSADGAWLDDLGSEDSQGRAALALAHAAVEAPEVPMREAARSLLLRAMPGFRRLTALRAVSAALIACEMALAGGIGGEVVHTRDRLARRLRRAFAGVDLASDWPWPEPVLSYENALLPRALIVAGGRAADSDLRRAGLRVLDWLTRVQTSRDGEFSPVGNAAWWPRGGARSRFDQQPIEAATMIRAAEAAFAATGDARYRRTAESAYGWFLGDNDAGLAVADVVTGGCHDGLSSGRVNRNQGAESTLMWLTALETMRIMRRPRSRAASAARRDAGMAITGPLR
jgi:hypothetical protein